MTTPSVLKDFNKFAGREVSVQEKSRTFGGHTLVEAKIKKGDVVTGEIEQAAKQHALQLRIFLPGQFGTTDYKPNRLNVYVKKEQDGKYRVQKNFSLG